MSELATNPGRKRPALALFLAFLAGLIPGVAGSFLFGQKLDQLLGLFALFDLGGGLGVFRFPLVPFLGLNAGALGGFRGQALFLGALGQALVARLGNGGAFLGTQVGGLLGGLGAGL